MLTPVNMAMIEQANKGMAGLIHNYFAKLVNTGFTRKEALKITLNFQEGLIGSASKMAKEDDYDEQ